MTTPGDDSVLLSLRGITKRYAAPVLRDVDLYLRGGEVHALLGANGAGKSTLSKIINGLVRADSGTMTLCGRPYVPLSKADAERCGVQIVQQELNLIPNLTVAENLFLNRLPRRFGCVSYRRLNRDAERALALVGLTDVRPHARVESLGVGRQQLVEIAAALARDCRVLILDEPTAALTPSEIDRLFSRVRALRERGVGVIYISHRLDEIREIADRATVLTDGRVVGTTDVDRLTVEDMIRQMLPGQTIVASPRRDATFGSSALRVAGLTRGTMVRDVSFAVRHGERLGISGLVGSGRTELLRAIFGADPADCGAVYVGDDPRPRRFQHPREAAAAGLALITEDRKQDGLLIPQSVQINTTLATLPRFRRSWGRLDRRRERQAAGRLADQLDTHCTSIDQSVAELSGGNQQKVVVAKWLLKNADVLLMDEPTRGVDAAARSRLYKLFDELAAQGKAMVLVSSDIHELMTCCDRILVLAAGRAVATFSRSAWCYERILTAAFGGRVPSHGRSHLEELFTS